MRLETWKDFFEHIAYLLAALVGFCLGLKLAFLTPDKWFSWLFS